MVLLNFGNEFQTLCLIGSVIHAFLVTSLETSMGLGPYVCCIEGKGNKVTLLFVFVVLGVTYGC